MNKYEKYEANMNDLLGIRPLRDPWWRRVVGVDVPAVFVYSQTRFLFTSPVLIVHIPAWAFFYDVLFMFTCFDVECPSFIVKSAPRCTRRSMNNSGKVPDPYPIASREEISLRGEPPYFDHLQIWVSQPAWPLLGETCIVMSGYPMAPSSEIALPHTLRVVGF